jgi:hypothetical protein
VKISDIGFSVSKIDGQRVVSFGVVVKNESSKIADQADIAIRLLDSSGRPIAFGEAADRVRKEADRLVWALRPGQRHGIGEAVYLDPAISASTEVARVDAKIDSTVWAGKKVHGLPNFTLGDLRIQRDGHGSSGRIRFSVNSPYDEPAPSSCVDVVFRDSRGEIVGGEHPSDVTPERFPAGKSKATALVVYLPPSTEDTESEMYAAAVCNNPN